MTQPEYASLSLSGRFAYSYYNSCGFSPAPKCLCGSIVRPYRQYVNSFMFKCDKCFGKHEAIVPMSIHLGVDDPGWWDACFVLNLNLLSHCYIGRYACH